MPVFSRILLGILGAAFLLIALLFAWVALAIGAVALAVLLVRAWWQGRLHWRRSPESPGGETVIIEGEYTVHGDASPGEHPRLPDRERPGE